MPISIRLFGGFIAHNACTQNGDVAHFGLAHLKDDLAPRRRHGIVEMDNGGLGTAQRVKACADQVFA